jgi:FkbM family methyltransferase
VRRGRVVVIEADSENCAALRRVIERHRLHNIRVVECGAWDRTSTLRFLANPRHPASSVLRDVAELSDLELRRRGFEVKEIAVETIDNILHEIGAKPPALVSITTNGAELKILAGLCETMARGCRYISLAPTSEGLHQHMTLLGYTCIARDDRGFVYEKMPPSEAPTTCKPSPTETA